ncbi:MAG: DEAD/DEAH box helicase [Caldilineales bacterium]|nr:DEAD/DEAH box helicase [Caldilineales bacterium]
MMALDMQRVRMLIADDVGLGKTIEAGLIITELMARQMVGRLLVVCPANLREQWQEALDYFFHIDARILSSRHVRVMERELPAGTNPWAHYKALIVSIDYAKQPAIKAQIFEQGWDVVLVDEAHTAAKPHQSGPNQRVVMDRWQFVQALSQRAHHLLLLTATPHNGYTDSFASLLRMLDIGAVSGDVDAPRIHRQVAQRYMCQRRREDIRSWFADSPDRYPFPERDASEVVVSPTTYEGQAIAAVEDYGNRVMEQASGSRAEVLAHWTVMHLHKRALSSPEALRRSLRNRRISLERRLASQDGIEEGMLPPEVARANALDEDTGDRITPEEAGERVERLAFGQTSTLVQAELAKLDELIALAERVTPSRDGKLQKLLDSTLWQRLATYPKCIIFTRYVDTLNYLAEQIGKRKQYADTAVFTIHGSMNDAQRRETLRAFERAPLAVLVATDAISEGMNLQHYAAQVIHYELPWNPNRLEQRNGRVDRFGQRKPVVYIRTMVMDETLDAKILDVMVRKAERIRRDYGFSPPYFGDETTVLDLIRMHDHRQQRSLFESVDDSTGIDPFGDEVLARIRSDSFYGQFDVSLPEVEARLAETVATVGSKEEIQAFVLAGLRQFGCDVVARDETIETWRINVSSPWLRGAGLPDRVEAATFDPEAALDDPDLTLIDLGNPLVRRLIELVKREAFTQSAAYGRSAYFVSPDVAEVMALLHVLARFVVATEPPNIVETLIPVALNLAGDVVAWGDAARPLLAARRTAERVPTADVQEDITLALNDPKLHTTVAALVEQHRQTLAAERSRLRQRLTAQDGDAARWLYGLDHLDTGSFDLLTITMLYPV